jgi:peptide chain release factor 2
MTNSDFWSDHQRAQSITKKLDNLKKEVSEWLQFSQELSELKELAIMGEAEADQALKSDLNAKFDLLKDLFAEFRLTTFLSGRYDEYNAILSIHAGAGGVDAQDWTEMLLRMYLRFSEIKKFKTSIIHESRGTEAGIKSVVIDIVGNHAYGYLKCEAGVHRLVRQSPFNSTHTRETSFALVEVLPMIETVEFKLDEKEIEIEAKTSRGHGGQSVNTTYSAIRATHKPTGLTVTIQNERSQSQNKAQAMKILASKLAAQAQEEEEKEKEKIRGEYHSAEWGNQIRSYVLHPYKLVKDHRTNYEVSDTDSVLDGHLEDFIKVYLEEHRKKDE